MRFNIETAGKTARRSVSRRAVVATLAAFGLAHVPSAFAQPVVDNFEMGKRTTWLTRSERFESVTFFRIDAADGTLGTLGISFVPELRVPAVVGRVVRFPALEARGVLLIELAEHTSPKAILPLVADYNLDHSHGPARYVAVAGNQSTGSPAAGNPVYSAGSVDNVVLDEVIVRFVKDADAQEIQRTFDDLGARVIRSGPGSTTGSYIIRFPGLSGHATRELSNRLDSLEHVQFAQPNFVIIDPAYLSGAGLTSGPQACPSRCPEAAPAVIVGDKFFASQWHLKNDGTSGTMFADTNAPKAWQKTAGDPAIVIAVLDDLVEIGHPDLAAKIVEPWDAFCESGADSSLTLTATDDHGTAVAGLAAAVTDNLIGVAGIAPKVRIMPIRTHDDSPCGIVDGAPIGNHGAIGAAIVHAAERGVDVLNMSFVMGYASAWPNGIPEVEDALNNENVKKRVLVISAGYRTGATGSDADYPASRADTYDNIIPVSATDRFDALKVKTDFSSGCDWSSNYSVEAVAAPGVDLYTTDRSGDAGYCTTGEDSAYGKFSGVSASTPLVAGAAALLLSKYRYLTPLQVRRRLQQTAEHPAPGSRPGDATTTFNPSGWGIGWGRIDICRAIEADASCDRPRVPSAPAWLDVH